MRKKQAAIPAVFLENQKKRPKLLDKRDVQANVRAEDRAENAKVKQRSGGQCEVVISKLTNPFWIIARIDRRCVRRASQIHHLRSGIGIRNRGTSIKASAKLHVCDAHHSEIHGHVLKPSNEAERYEASTVRYERQA